MTLPSKSLFSIAYIFGNKGLISLDYELTKYSNSKFNDNNGNDTYMKSLNGIIKNNLDGISESIRIGGEYRIKNYNLRAGYYITTDLILPMRITDQAYHWVLESIMVFLMLILVFQNQTIFIKINYILMG